MRSPVLFLAPGIQPASGGVADYCRLLVGALSGDGIECHLASWSESGGTLLTEPAPRTIFLHQPGSSSVASKAARLREYLNDHNIEWVSLQFVNFGFGKRGLIPGLASALAPALQGKRLHLFLHELWVRDHHGLNLRHRLLGAWQRRQLLQLVRVLKAEEVWTSIDFYARQLAREGVHASTVPIFGNIPVSSARADEWILQRLGRGSRDEYWFVGLFGTIDRGWPFDAVVPRVLEAGGEKKVVFVLFGKNGDADAFVQYVRSLPGAELLSLGPHDEETVDRLLNSMDLALATTPAEGIFKSGSAVAFLERGVPVVAVHGGLEAPGASGAQAHPNVVLCDDNFEENLTAAASSRQRRALLPTVKRQYLEMFSSARPAQVADALEPIVSFNSPA